MTMYFVTQSMLTYISVVWSLQLEDERERIVNGFNIGDQQRGIEWKYNRTPFWSFNLKRSFILIEFDASSRMSLPNVIHFKF
ncbi:4015_t:CDS:2 [Paraglomus brasilianum]|uniref:4015_t:CDS:1 n=1 Tax=Paraglomus brasilianum TaxID=144538 RepID=A0A9N9B3B5_9GLOM|nr:4015_t:CDS:2 [Paraglomus brasilianum]